MVQFYIYIKSLIVIHRIITFNCFDTDKAMKNEMNICVYRTSHDYYLFLVCLQFVGFVVLNFSYSLGIL